MAPPRNRRRKVGLMRIDAALAAMRPMGFSDRIVRKSVRDLLKVYGDDGWAFIEEASYTLLIETIIETEKLAQKEEFGGRGGEDDAGGSSQSSSQPALQLREKKNSKEEEKCAQAEIDDDKREGKKIQLDNYLIPKDETELALPGSQLDFAPTCSPMIVDCAPIKQIRNPCYGWISDDDEADDFLLLPAADGPDPN